MELQDKILNSFCGKVVRKDLAFQVKGGLPVPTYVLEYLLGQYCATDDPDAIEQGLEGAFLDRIHLYNPGWEIKMLKKDSFTKRYCLISDYLAAILHALQDRDLTGLMKQYATFDGSLSERDHNAIRKTFSGMVKLLYPDGNMTDEEAYEIIDFATESRKRVKDQLYIIDETFRAEPAKFQYTNLKNCQTCMVETLERVENPIIPEIDESYKDGEESNNEETDVTESIGNQTKNSKKTRPRITQLASKQINIRLNQKGVTWKSLFGEYLRDAKKIVVTDPFVRLPYQITNLVELIQMIQDISMHPEDLTVELHT